MALYPYRVRSNALLCDRRVQVWPLGVLKSTRLPHEAASDRRF
jgi:hypothetical protein